jgi:bifunctional non-homologous end joining protein LigD
MTRRGNDWTSRYPSIAAAVAALSCRSCLIDGEVVICGEDGIPIFDRLRYGRRPQTEAALFAFDLLELAGKDLGRTPLEERKRALVKAATKGIVGSSAKRPHCRARRPHIPPRLQARIRGHRIETARIALPVGSLALLDQEQESGR